MHESKIGVKKENLISSLRRELLRPYEERATAFIDGLLSTPEYIAGISESGVGSLPCFECGKDTLTLHHVVPVIYGGTKAIPLCEYHHGLAHSMKISSPALIKIGIQRARERGTRLGRPSKMSEPDIVKIIQRSKGGGSLTKIGKEFGISRSYVSKILTKYSGVYEKQTVFSETTEF